MIWADRILSFPLLRFRSIAFLLLLFSISFSPPNALATGSRCSELFGQAEPTIQHFVPWRISSGPFGQTLQRTVFEVSRSKESVEFFGSELALAHITPEAVKVRSFLERLTGRDEPGILVARGISGSVTRLRQFRIANDVDGEALVIVKLDKPEADPLHNPESEPSKRLVEFMRNHIQRTVYENPDYRFIELKAGEYSDPVTGETKGVKWSLPEIIRGFKLIDTAQGKRLITLQEAFAEDARVKADWAIPNGLSATLIPGSYMEASVLYRFGTQLGNNQIRLRSPRPHADFVEVLPIRATTVAFTERDLDLLNQASIASPSPPLEFIHQSMMKSIRKYKDHNPLKVLKRVFALLQFWEEPQEFNRLYRMNVSRDRLLDKIQSIITEPKILEIGQLRAEAELFKILQDHGIQGEEGRRELWIAQVRERYGIRGTKIEEILDEFEHKLKDLIDQEIAKNPEVVSYLEYIFKRTAYIDGQLIPGAAFITVAPPQDSPLVQSYRKNLPEWRRKYPALEFTDPQDLHLTLYFMGKLTDGAIQEVYRQIDRLGPVNWRFTNGGLRIMGRRNQLIAVRFETDPETTQSVLNLRAQATTVGAQPEKTFQDFVPHMSFVTIKGSSHAGRYQLDAFLKHELFMTGSPEFSADKIEIWTRDSETSPAGSPDQPSDRSIAPDSRSTYRPYPRKDPGAEDSRRNP